MTNPGNSTGAVGGGGGGVAAGGISAIATEVTEYTPISFHL